MLKVFYMKFNSTIYFIHFLIHKSISDLGENGQKKSVSSKNKINHLFKFLKELKVIVQNFSNKNIE